MLCSHHVYQRPFFLSLERLKSGNDYQVWKMAALMNPPPPQPLSRRSLIRVTFPVLASVLRSERPGHTTHLAFPGSTIFRPPPFVAVGA